MVTELDALALADTIYNILETPDIWSSKGAATVFARVSEFAPGNVAVTLILGGVISGYCETGEAKIATAPAITIIIEITIDNTGRKIKNLQNMKVTLYITSSYTLLKISAFVCTFVLSTITLSDGNTFIPPPTTTLSSSFKPLSITHN